MEKRREKERVETPKGRDKQNRGGQLGKEDSFFVSSSPLNGFFITTCQLYYYIIFECKTSLVMLIWCGPSLGCIIGPNLATTFLGFFYQFLVLFKFVFKKKKRVFLTMVGRLVESLTPPTNTY